MRRRSRPRVLIEAERNRVVSELDNTLSKLAPSWSTFDHEGRHYAWDAPELHALDKHPGTPCPQGLEVALQRVGLTIEHVLEDDVSRELAQGRQQVFETDKRA